MDSASAERDTEDIPGPGRGKRSQLRYCSGHSAYKWGQTVRAEPSGSSALGWVWSLMNLCPNLRPVTEGVVISFWLSCAAFGSNTLVKLPLI